MISLTLLVSETDVQFKGTLSISKLSVIKTSVNYKDKQHFSCL